MTLPPNLFRHHINSPLGPLLLAASANGMAGVWFSGQKHHPAPELLGRWPLAPSHPLLVRAAGQLARYFQRPEAHGKDRPPTSPSPAGWAFDLPLDLSTGSPFQQSVWRALLDIAPGATCHYADIARRIGRPGASRAVGSAVGRNPLSIIVPCHRVLGSGGTLTGYAGGLERKAALLRHEGHRQAWLEQAVPVKAWARADKTAATATATAAATATATSAKP